MLVRALVQPDLIISKFLMGHLQSSDRVNTREGEKFLNALLTVFMNHTFKSTMHLMEYCIEYEVLNTSSANNLFRRNGVAPKILSKFALAVGQEHLEDMLKPLILNVTQSSKTYEIDPHRLKDKENLEKNIENLTRKCQRFVDTIVAAKSPLPIAFQWIAYSLRQIVSKKFPNAVNISLASFYFLRFLCPAIVAPVHYNLAEKQPKTKTCRFLILIAKTLQSLANRSDDKAALEKKWIKEPYMKVMQPFIEANREKVYTFLQSMSEVVGKSDVLPAFDKLDTRRLTRSLRFTHHYLFENLDDMLKDEIPEDYEERPAPSAASTSGSAPGIPTALSGSLERLSNSIDDEKVNRSRRDLSLGDDAFAGVTSFESLTRSGSTVSNMTTSSILDKATVLRAFRDIVDDLGPPLFRVTRQFSLNEADMSGSNTEATDTVGRLNRENQKEPGEKPGFLKRLSNRLLAGMRPQHPLAELAEMKILKAHTEELHSKYIVLLEERTLMMQEKDKELSELHGQHQHTLDQNAALLEYISSLENRLLAHGLEVPTRPKVVSMFNLNPLWDVPAVNASGNASGKAISVTGDGDEEETKEADTRSAVGSISVADDDKRHSLLTNSLLQIGALHRSESTATDATEVKETGMDTPVMDTLHVDTTQPDGDVSPTRASSLSTAHTPKRVGGDSIDLASSTNSNSPLGSLPSSNRSTVSTHGGTPNVEIGSMPKFQRRRSDALSTVNSLKIENNTLRNHNSRLTVGANQLSLRIRQLHGRNESLRAVIEFQEMQLEKMKNTVEVTLLENSFTDSQHHLGDEDANSATPLRSVSPASPSGINIQRKE